MSYMIVRFYDAPSVSNIIIADGLTLEEAQEHCSSPDSSSRTSTDPEAEDHTWIYGHWQDDYVPSSPDNDSWRDRI